MRKSRVPSAAFRNRKAVLLDVRARRNTTRKRCRARIFNVIWKTGAVTALIAGTWFGAHRLLTKFFYTNPNYNICHITTQSEGILTKKEILTATGLRAGMNIFTIDLERARKGLLAISQIQNASIERILPDTIRIHVQQKKPVAWLIFGKNSKASAPFENSFLVEQQGTFYKPLYSLSRYYSLPVIYGIDPHLLAVSDPLATEDLHQALELLRLAAQRQDPSLLLQSLDLSNGYCIKAQGPSKEVITFSTENFDEQLDRLQELTRFCKRTGKQIESVNLFVHRNTPVRFGALPE